MFSFGTGDLVTTALTDAYGAPLASPTPIRVGILQDSSVDFSFDIKELYGQYQFPVAIGRGKGKITGKSKFAQINGLTLNSMVFGQTLVSGSLSSYIDNVGTAIPASAPYTITPTVPGSGTYATDQGVLGPNGIPLVKVVSGPTTGQYSATGGVYTFAAADTGNIVRISYQYTATSTVAKKMTIANLPMGSAPTFRADLATSFGGKQFILTLPCCTGSKFSLATKMDDFTIPEFDFSAFADPLNNVAYLAMAE